VIRMITVTTSLAKTLSLMDRVSLAWPG
jgi:hypothetical protein